jgi:diaminopimelate epimerase
MNLKFSKYHGAGNDFILIDAVSQQVNLSELEINTLCNRRFGIGADGLMLVLPSDSYDFKMKYYNADGREGTMCGNGGRCIVAFAQKLGLVKNIAKFIAIDGEHKAECLQDGNVSLGMNNVLKIETFNDGWFVDTGSPHFVQQVNNISSVDINVLGKALRFDSRFELGTNVNFFEIKNNQIHIRTFERGVEAETLACGTGAVALAVVLAYTHTSQFPIEINAKGGVLKVEGLSASGGYLNIVLTGPVQHVFDGEVLN